MQNQNIEQKRADLENRAWYRFLKVVYILAIIFIILVVGFFAWIAKPTQVVDYEKTYFKCNSDPESVYSLGKNNVYLRYDDTMYGTDDRRARSTCRDDKDSSFVPDEKNYTLVVAHKNNYSYISWLGYTALAFFGVWAAFKLLSIAFFYIVIGKKPTIPKN